MLGPSGRTDFLPQGWSDSDFLIPSVSSWKLDSGEQGLSPSSSSAWEVLQKPGLAAVTGAGRLEGKWECRDLMASDLFAH